MTAREIKTVPGTGYIQFWINGRLIETLDPVEARMAGIQLINASPEAERLAGEAAARAAGETVFQEIDQ